MRDRTLVFFFLSGLTVFAVVDAPSRNLCLSFSAFQRSFRDHDAPLPVDLFSPGFPFLAVLLPYSRFVASPGFQSSVIDLICLAAYVYVVQPFIFTFSCVPVGTLGIESDVAGLELHCNDHTQAAVRNYIYIYIYVGS